MRCTFTNTWIRRHTFLFVDDRFRWDQIDRSDKYRARNTPSFARSSGSVVVIGKPAYDILPYSRRKFQGVHDNVACLWQRSCASVANDRDHWAARYVQLNFAHAQSQSICMRYSCCPRQYRYLVYVNLDSAPHNLEFTGESLTCSRSKLGTRWGYVHSPRAVPATGTWESIRLRVSQLYVGAGESLWYGWCHIDFRPTKELAP